MDAGVLEKEAKKLFGGATVVLNPYNDGIKQYTDLSIIPYIDKQLRFIRLDATGGMPAALAYLKKIQQHLLALKTKGAFGIQPIEEEVDQDKVDEVIKKKMKDTFICDKCNKTFSHKGPFGMHRKAH